MTGRPPKVPRETLEPLLAQLRSEGSTAKAMARAFGYSVDHIFKLCAKWGIKKQLKPIKSVDQEQFQKLRSQYDGSGASAGITTAPAASGSDTGQLPEQGIS